jgi:hypothetical protein
MSPLSNSIRAALSAALLGVSACSASPAATDTETGTSTSAEVVDPPAIRMGLMSSLPLYWPLGADLAAIAQGQGQVPWQRTALARSYALEPLDTLSSIPALAADQPDLDPLSGLRRIAIIQPRGLSASDNVALDRWVRAGGRLLLVLDPALTGEYDLPLGDPRRPVDTALFPPVVARWGLAVSFDEDQAGSVTIARLGETALPLALSGAVAITDPKAADCTLLANGAAARCRVGRGEVTLIADAALFEHQELAGEGGATMRAVIAGALR